MNVSLIALKLKQLKYYIAITFKLETFSIIYIQYNWLTYLQNHYNLLFLLIYSLGENPYLFLKHLQKYDDELKPQHRDNSSTFF